MSFNVCAALRVARAENDLFSVLPNKKLTCTCLKIIEKLALTRSPGDHQNERWERDKNKRGCSSREECDTLQRYTSACHTDDMSNLSLCWLVALVCCKCQDKLSKKSNGSSSGVSTISVTGLNRRHVTSAMCLPCVVLCGFLSVL